MKGAIRLLKQIRYFQSVVRLGSFTAAAEEHYIAQCAISQQIRALEEELGTALSERSDVSVEVIHGNHDTIYDMLRRDELGLVLNQGNGGQVHRDTQGAVLRARKQIKITCPGCYQCPALFYRKNFL